MESESLVFAADHPAFAGHFPGTPIVPGVLLLDAALHAAESDAAATVASIPSAKFLQPVSPDEVVSLACSRTAAGRTDFEFTSGGARVAAGQFQMTPASDDR